MSSTILINHVNEELRVAILKEQQFHDFFVQLPEQTPPSKGNIYLATIESIEKSLNAAFVRYQQDGQKKHGFLPLSNISKAHIDPDSDKPAHEQLKIGQILKVQVEKEERGTKGAALTNLLSLAGSYLVLMPNKPGTLGISKRISQEKREAIKSRLSKLPLPENMGLIVRTAGIDCSVSELNWDLNYLLNLWKNIERVAGENRPPAFLYQERDAMYRIVRDNLKSDQDRIVTDDVKTFNALQNHLHITRPNYEGLSLHDSTTPLFDFYNLQKKIDQLYEREVSLPSGGSLVFDRAEALTAIDINSARATRGSNIEETAYRTNLEATKIIAEQVMLRNIGGIIIIDFIDMMDDKHQHDIEKRLAEAFQRDSAQVYMTDMSRFCVIELSRQRIRPSLGDLHLKTCPVCKGRGTVRTLESLANSLLQTVASHANTPDVCTIEVQLHHELCTFLINEKRAAWHAIEQRHHIDLVFIVNPNYTYTTYQIKCLKSGQTSKRTPQKAQDVSFKKSTSKKQETPLVTPANTTLPQAPKKPIIQVILDKIFTKEAPKKTKQPHRRRTRHSGKSSQQRRGHHHRNKRHGNQTQKQQHHSQRVMQHRNHTDDETL